MFRLEMLPAAHGDALWITSGAPNAPRRILIDGGMRYVYKHLRAKLRALPPAHRKLDLLVVTHVDADHVEGTLRLLQDDALGVEVGEIWFNGQPQLDAVPSPIGDQLGAEQGEFLGALIGRLEERAGRPLWNARFGGGAVMVPGDGDLPAREVGELRLTVLTPGALELLRLKRTWKKVLEDADFEPGRRDSVLAALAKRGELAPPDRLGGADEEEVEEGELDLASHGFRAADALGGDDAEFGSDDSVANGSSIALLAEWAGGRALLAGDAHAPDLARGLRRWLQEESRRLDRQVKRVELDLFKLSHHGSVTNVSAELLDLLSCRRYLFSTSGKIYGHPHERTVELVLERHHRARGKPRLYFNYRTACNERWADAADQKKRRYEAHFPSGLGVELPAG